MPWWRPCPQRTDPGARMTSDDRPAQVLLLDDQVLVRAGFRMVIDSQPDLTVVGEVGDGLAAVEQTRRLGPDLVLMDVRVPVLDGIEATRRLLGHLASHWIPDQWAAGYGQLGCWGVSGK
jgi:CheY-like chemotaxis protein